jgi:ATP/maltotriose-dependent transcriptional regulator MalT
MRRKQTTIAKLSRPRLHSPVARERLFELVDKKRHHPVIWVSGPPGAGKTTLAGSYLEEAGVPAIWYHIDSGDSDPATFFVYLKQAFEVYARKSAKPLPLLTPEYLSDLPGFAKRFLRAGFARFPTDVIVVFDNYHDLAPDSRLHRAFKALMSEVPAGANLLVLSRLPPPPLFAEVIANQTLGLISWEELRLSENKPLQSATRQA